jgi:transglutaminase-like putative cysteine protease
VLALGAAAIACLAALAICFDVSPLALGPFDDDHFFGAIWSNADRGLREFYDTALPFRVHLHPDMRSLVELAIFAFALALGLTIRGRRPIGACAVLVAGAGWPATLLTGPGDLTRGALILGVALVLLAGLRPASPTLRPAFAAAAAVLAVALVASTSTAVARGSLLSWKTWNPYVHQQRVSVDYLWRAQYAGVTFPQRATTVFIVQAPQDPRYWRAATLDEFRDDVWNEAPVPILGGSRLVGRRDELLRDPQLPAGATDRRRWIEQRFEIKALRDDHLVAAAVPVAYQSDDLRVGQYDAGGVATVPEGTRSGQSYTVWSYDDRPSPASLARVRSVVPPGGPEGARYLAVWDNLTVPPFGVRGRDAAIRAQFAAFPPLARYAPLYRAALRAVGGARTPYGAAVALETWFRRIGGFFYDEQPPAPPAGVPALVDFVTRSRAGYCQHYAGAMALMLRYLGVPARVAVGFTSGSYDRDRKQWTVTDLNAHAWVEVYLGRYGWLPFDPTPGRGTFDAPYSNASASFDASGAAAALAGTRALGLGALERLLEQRRDSLPKGSTFDPGAQGAGKGSSRGRGLGRGAALTLALLAAMALLWLGKLARRRLRYLTRDPRRLAAACRRELAELVADQGVDVAPGATLAELARQVSIELGVDPQRFAGAAARARFGPPALAPAAAREARHELRAVRRALRHRLTTRERLLGLVSLRSLRFQA